MDADVVVDVDADVDVDSLPRVGLDACRDCPSTLCSSAPPPTVSARACRRCGLRLLCQAPAVQPELPNQLRRLSHPKQHPPAQAALSSTSTAVITHTAAAASCPQIPHHTPVLPANELRPRADVDMRECSPYISLPVNASPPGYPRYVVWPSATGRDGQPARSSA